MLWSTRMRPCSFVSLPKKENAMQSPGFDLESERYMMDHMNADHADSNLMYVKVYGNLWSATAARMVRLDKEGMDLEVTVPDGTQRLRIPFDHRLEDEADAQRTLVAMSRHAQTVITQTGQPPLPAP
jgi:putative heme iron utilization protein